MSKVEDIGYSIPVCQPSTTLCSLKNWFTCSTSSIVHAKSSSHSNLFWKTVKKEPVDTFIRSKTILLWKNRSSFVAQAAQTIEKGDNGKWILLIFTPGNDLIPKGDFKILLTWLILRHYSQMYTWDVKTLYYQNRFSETLMSIVLFSRRIADDPTKITSVSLEHLLYFCKVRRSWKKKLRKISTFFSTTPGYKMCQKLKVFTLTFF